LKSTSKEKENAEHYYKSARPLPKLINFAQLALLLNKRYASFAHLSTIHNASVYTSAKWLLVAFTMILDTAQKKTTPFPSIPFVLRDDLSNALFLLFQFFSKFSPEPGGFNISFLTEFSPRSSVEALSRTSLATA
jgi:hypothetical protein